MPIAKFAKFKTRLMFENLASANPRKFKLAKIKSLKVVEIQEEISSSMTKMLLQMTMLEAILAIVGNLRLFQVLDSKRFGARRHFSYTLAHLLLKWALLVHGYSKNMQKSRKK